MGVVKEEDVSRTIRRERFDHDNVDKKRSCRCKSKVALDEVKDVDNYDRGWDTW